MELYWNDNYTAYAVLVSRGFGAGWSTWDHEKITDISCDRRVVEFYLAHHDNKIWMWECDHYSNGGSFAYKEAEKFFDSIGYKECPYMGGFADIGLEWVPAGSYWRIDEYDGAETLIIDHESLWKHYE